jgi:biotin carboxyl carrier protein
MQRFRIVLDGQTYEVEVGDPGQHPLTVVVDGETFHLEVEPLAASSPEAEAGPAARPAPSPAAPAPPAARPVAAGPGEITAPMPGKVLDLAVEPGDAVEPGQTLCALEAMKMKSPIRAMQAGTIRDVLVHEGQSVTYGEPLFVIR